MAKEKDITKHTEHTKHTEQTKPQNHHEFEVGRFYTDRQGWEWKCLLIHDDRAYLRMNGDDTAYSWSLDGTNISFEDNYNIDLGPVRGEVVKYIDGDFRFTGRSLGGDTHKITIPTLDGKPAVGTYTGENGLRVKIEEVE